MTVLDFRPGRQLRWVWGCDGLQCESHAAPELLWCATGRGSHEPGKRCPEQRQWTDGTGEPRLAGDHDELDGDFQLDGAQAQVIFDNLDGSISASNGGASSTIEVTVAGASFTRDFVRLVN